MIDEVRLPERFISVKEAANFDEWIRKRRKIVPGPRVDLSYMEGMEIIPNLFENIRVGGRDISFDDRMLNTIVGTPENGMGFYTKNKKSFDPNLYREKTFEELFTKGEDLKRHDDRNVNKLDAYGRRLHHMISNIIIPNVSHRNEKGMLVRGGQGDDVESDEEEEEDEDEGQDAINVDEQVSEEEPKEETFRREMRQKKREKELKKDNHSDGKISDIQERVMKLEARVREEDR
ncbi:hypothetical protein M9H77_08904 [Catharanthus roseus]|uniref:Uncharacterized protein n=1 Tax=Catharanthus roseus TaxID=4058 RepID=A0ACC0BZF0_CATRO|nr:hypothetical protein M9H77_08904 [Catharanthus roseus]